MPAVLSVTEFICPGCGAVLRPPGHEGDTSCPNCNWAGSATLFRPILPEVERAVAALPEEAACAHHPSKRAVAVCAGTGDYICALCSIELEGQTYSAQHLSGGGKERATKAFDRYLPRPDKELSQIVTLCYLFGILSPILVPMGIFRYRKLLRMHRENPLLSRLVSRTRMTVLLVFLLLYGVVALMVVGAALVGMVMAFVSGR